MVRVLIVEDSLVACELLKHILSSDPEIEVVGTARDGVAALEFLRRKRPDVITMDTVLPKMDGLETTRRIMETSPVPIILVSASISDDEVSRTFQAVDAGAVAVLEKPQCADIGVEGGDAEKLIKTVKAMSQVGVVRRWARQRKEKESPEVETVLKEGVCTHPERIEVVAIAGSTGAPAVLQTIFSRLPQDFPAPILLVQHISPGFTRGFLQWLGTTSVLCVRPASDGEPILPGNVYVAPDACHLGISRDRRIKLAKTPSREGIARSASHLFRSVALALGSRAVGVVLTGMGKDGASEMKLLRDCGGVTIAQDEESCIVYGMPAEAVKLGGVQYSLSPTAIAEMLIELTAQPPKTEASQ